MLNRRNFFQMLGGLLAGLPLIGHATKLVPRVGEPMSPVPETLVEPKYLYLLVHEHRFGADTWPFYATRNKFDSLSAEEIAFGLGVEYEPSREEYLTVRRLDSTVDPTPDLSDFDPESIKWTCPFCFDEYSGSEAFEAQRNYEFDLNCRGGLGSCERL